MADIPDECPVCSRGGAIVTGARFDGWAISCELCLTFEITRPLYINWQNRLEEGEQTLRRYLPAHLRQSPEITRLTTENWKRLAQAHSATRIPQKADKLLQLCAQKTEIAGDPVKVDPLLEYPMIDAASPGEILYLLEYLLESKYIERGNLGRDDDEENEYVVTVKGWQKLEIPPGGIPGRCFVAMSFDPSLNEAYESGIGAAVKDCGLPKPIRMDLEQHNDKICDKILAEIRSCQFMVADFTLQRPGVYFEAGFAMGLGRPVIWMCRQNDFKKLHFDTRQYNHIEWSEPLDLREKLRDRIRATILRYLGAMHFLAYQ